MKFTANIGIKFVPQLCKFFVNVKCKLCKNIGCNFTTTDTGRFGLKLQLNSNFQLGDTSDFPEVKEIHYTIFPALTSRAAYSMF